MRGFNSTIKMKLKPCARCGKDCYWFSKKRCKDCARIEDIMNEQEEETEQAIKEEGLQDLIKDADTIFSRWVRLSNSDKDGNVSCYTCDVTKHWTLMQNGHYIKRGNLFLRFDPRNCRVQCEGCNVYKDGNYAEYTQRLEKERPGIVEYLLEESRLVYKPTRLEIKNIITEYTLKIKQLKHNA
jgi:predicted thioredoxin/glutaredoxin